MKWQLPWRRSRSSTPEPEGSTEAPPEESEIVGALGPPTIEPHECFYKTFHDHPGPCPRCGGPLRQRHQAYLVETWHQEQPADSFIIGGSFGWFCSKCSVVVINPEDVIEFLQAPPHHWDIGRIVYLVGFADLEAIPEEKAYLPLGSEDNPLPVVEFTRITYLDEPTSLLPPQPPRRSKKARKRKKRRKRKRRR